MNVLALIGVAGGLVALGLLAVVSLVGRRVLVASLFGASAAALAILYAGGLLASSLTSEERLLAVGETKRFCGFYLDCHLGASVERVAVTPAIGGLSAGSGVFHVVTLRISSNAVRATLRPSHLDVAVVDLEGRRYERAREAEAALAGLRGTEIEPLERAVPAGGSYTVTVVFDLPADLIAPRLLVREGDGANRIIERVLIGDEDALFHRPVLLSLPKPT